MSLGLWGALISPFATFSNPTCSCKRQTNYDIFQNPYCGSPRAKNAKNLFFPDLPRVRAKYKKCVRQAS